MSKYIKNRFALVTLLIVIFIAISFTSRIILLFADFDQVDFGIFVLIKLFLVGLIYDFVAAMYFVAPRYKNRINHIKKGSHSLTT